MAVSFRGNVPVAWNGASSWFWSSVLAKLNSFLPQALIQNTSYIVHNIPSLYRFLSPPPQRLSQWIWPHADYMNKFCWYEDWNLNSCEIMLIAEANICFIEQNTVLFHTVNVVPVLLFLTEHHVMNSYCGTGGIAPRILDIGTRWRWVVSFTPRLYPPGKEPLVHIE
jgi:hypothetical protein